jgi:2-C-methyl-D-erythritol 4-phosphate cytidylyltransferase
MTLWAVVPAAGSGSRMGADAPKQYLSVHGRTLLELSVAAVLADTRVRGCVVALPPGDAAARRLELFDDPRLRACDGGATRAQSVRRALASLDAAPDDWVLVHDAARPCLPPDALATLIDRVLECGEGGLLAQPQTDTLKRDDGAGRVQQTLPRDGLWRAQTPQMFPVQALCAALDAAAAADAEVTDEASAMERAGHPVQLVPGPACNIKVTFAEDLAFVSAWLQRQLDLPPEPQEAPAQMPVAPAASGEALP